MKLADRWFLGATILTAGQGGIACVARMTGKTLTESGASSGMLSLLDASPVEIAGEMAATARGSRLKYVGLCHKAAMSHDRFLYDSVGTARAHPSLSYLRKPYGVWIHGVEVWAGLHAGREKALRQADFVLVNSQFTLDKFQDIHWVLENALVCRLATEEDEPPENLPRFDGSPTVLIVARIDAGELYKGHAELIDIWPEVIAEVPGARLTVVGGGSGLGTIKAASNRSPARANIDVLGYVAEDELERLWQSAHIFAMPSRGEGFGLVYIEAMRHSLPVIASLHDAGQEVNVDGETGYNIDLDRPGELAERLIVLLSRPDQAMEMGQAGHKRWREHFRYSAFKKRLLGCLSA